VLCAWPSTDESGVKNKKFVEMRIEDSELALCVYSGLVELRLVEKSGERF
jgi:hypothetical protein